MRLGVERVRQDLQTIYEPRTIVQPQCTNDLVDEPGSSKVCACPHFACTHSSILKNRKKQGKSVAHRRDSSSRWCSLAVPSESRGDWIRTSAPLRPRRRS
jgi:hypothetical protein